MKRIILNIALLLFVVSNINAQELKEIRIYKNGYIWYSNILTSSDSINFSKSGLSRWLHYIQNDNEVETVNISEIDSIIFKQITGESLFIPLNSSNPLFCRYTKENKSVSFYGTKDENGLPLLLEAVFIKDENDEIIMQIYLDEYERPIKFFTADNLLICDYLPDKTLITLATEEGMIYSREMDIVIPEGKSIFHSFRNQNSTNRKCIIQVSNCGEPFDKGEVAVQASVPYNDIVFETFPAKNIGGGLYECTIPYRTAFYINPNGMCNYLKEKLVWFTDNILCNIFSNPAFCEVFAEAMGICLTITEILEVLCVNDGQGIITLEEALIRCDFYTDKDYYITDMRLTPRLNALPHSIIGESVVIAGDAPIPNLSINTYYDCELNPIPALIVSNIQKTSASAFVQVLDLNFFGSIDEIGVCYSLSNSNPTIENGGTIKKQKTYGFGSSVSLPLVNLIAGTKYYIRPYVKKVIADNESYVYGDVQNFTTVAYDCQDFDNSQGVVINGVCWATRNIGASSPCDYGNYYTWEEVQSVCSTGCLPTSDDINKLSDITKVAREGILLNGINGWKFTDKTTGNAIFFPASGDYFGDMSGWNQIIGGPTFIGGYGTAYVRAVAH